VNVLTSNLTRAEAYLAYRTTWIPSVTYSLSVTTLTCQQLEHIQMRATGHFLSKMVLNSHIPRAVAMGPIVMGGLALRSLPTEQGIQQTLTLMGHLYNKTELGKMIQIELDTLQVEAGTANGLLQEPTTTIPYLIRTWIISLRDFLSKNQIAFEFAEQWNFHLSRQKEQHIMDIFLASKMYSNNDLQNLNLVCLHMQVATLSDIRTACGRDITRKAYRGIKNGIWHSLSGHANPKYLSASSASGNRHWTPISLQPPTNLPADISIFSFANLWESGLNPLTRLGHITQITINRYCFQETSTGVYVSTKES
jgi:hypothetical protein